MATPPIRDPSYWKADAAFLAPFVPLRELLRRPRISPCETDVSVTLEDMPALRAFRVDGFRLTLALGPAVVPSFAFDRSAGNKTEVFPHLGIIQLSSFLRAFGAVVTVRDALVDAGFSDADKIAISDLARLQRALGGAADADLDALLDRWIAYLALETADAVALSAANEADPLTFVLLRRRLAALGRRVPPLVMGGQWLHDAFRPFAAEIDVLVLEEGEVPLLLACHALRNRQDPHWIPGVARLGSGGAEHLHKVTHAMNVRAVPDLTGLALARYTHQSYTGWGEPTIPYQFSLGCPFDCAYCNAIHKRRVKQRDHRLVLHDLERMHEQHGVSHFFFLNEAFNSNLKYAGALLESLTAAGRDWHWSDCARPTNISFDLLTRMRRAGCDWLNWGYDTPSDRMSEFYGRRVKNAAFAEVLADASRAGIRNSINVIIGMPHEQEEDIEEFLGFMERNRPHIDWVFFFSYDFIPHSSMGRQPERYGLRLGAQGGVDEVGGLTWSDRQLRGQETKQRVMKLLADRYGYR